MRRVCNSFLPRSHQPWLSRRLSTDNVGKSFPTLQGGTLSIDYTLDQLHLEIIPSWQEELHVSVEDGCKELLDIDHDTSNNIVYINEINSTADQTPNKVMKLKLVIPELFNVKVNANHLQLNMSNKLMGDMIVNCLEGKITVNRVKGEIIDLNVNKGDVEVKKVLEGNVHLACNSVWAKMINVNFLQASITNKVTIEALYNNNQAEITTNSGDIDIALMRGHLKASILQSGDMNIKGIDGSIDLFVNEGNIQTQINKLPLGNTTNTILASQGDIICQVDQEIKSRLKAEVSDMNGTIVINSETFQPKTDDIAHDSNTKIVHGKLLENFSTSKRPKFNKGNFHSGKINLFGAEIQSQLKAKGEAEFTTKFNENTLPLLHLQARSHIEVNAVSWMDLIKRKHGF